jgi:thiamine-phosphate pyrophosphorylase
LSGLPRGLYAITPDENDTVRLVAAVSAALEGGISILQYRHKQADAALRRAQAEALLPLCRAARVPFIVNDDLDLASALGADGLHLGGGDGDLMEARARLGPERLLGRSCYGDIENAAAAKKAGADHVAFGAMFPSRTKPHAKQASTELFAQARNLGLPAVGIGGITLDNAPQLVAAGAHAIAVITALFEAPDVAARAREFARLFK